MNAIQIRMPTTLAMVAMLALAGGCGDEDCPTAPHGPEHITGWITVETQDHLELFKGIRSISGGLVLAGQGIVDLSPLADLEVVGSLQISGTGVTSLQPLAQLDTVQTKLEIEANQHLATLAGLETLVSAREVSIDGNGNLVSLAPLTGIRNLQSLNVYHECRLHDVSGLAHGDSLTELALLDCDSLATLDFGDAPILLQSIWLHDLPELDTLAWPADGLPALETLSLLNMDLVGINPLDDGHLRILSITEVTGMVDLSWLRDPVEIGTFYLTHMDDLQRLDGLDGAEQIGSLRISRCANLHSLSALADVAYVGLLSLSDCPLIVSLASLTSELGGVSVTNCGLERLADDGSLTGCRQLIVQKCESFTSLQGLEAMASLERLQLADLPVLESYESQVTLPNLLRLGISNCPELSALSTSVSLPLATNLMLQSCDEMGTLDWLSALPKLQYLYIEGCNALTSLEGLPAMPDLEYLGVIECLGLASLGDQVDLTALERARIQDCPQLSDLSGPNYRYSLTILEILGCRRLVSLAGLEEIRRIESLYLTHNASLASLTGLEGIEVIGSLYIVGNYELPLATIEAFVDTVTITDFITIMDNG